MKKQNNERGTTLIFVAAAMFMIMGFAAIAVDVGHRYNERRQDQSAADAGVMAGSISYASGTDSLRDFALTYVRNNLDTTYSNAEWQASWTGCTDPNKNGGGFNFVAVPAPAGWGGTLDCLSIDLSGFVRVKVPDQFVETTFGKVVGVDQLQSTAAAIARISGRANGGILPFGVLAGAASGTSICLRDNSTPIPPCDSGDQGNYGAIESPHFGNPAIPTPENCNGSPKKDVLANNIAAGVDHPLVLDPDGVDANEILDQCTAPAAPDTINTFQGISQGLEEGLVGASVPIGVPGRLRQGGNAKRTIHGNPLDDKPLWEYLNYAFNGPAPSGVPATCGGFDNGTSDWDTTLPGNEPNKSWQHMQKCLTDYVAAGSTTIIFSTNLGSAPRFAYLPQFWENTWPNGNSAWRHIKAFRATYVQTTWWKKGGTTTPFSPGEPTGTFTGNAQLRQLSGFLLPDNTLPIELRGSAVGQPINPYIPELYR